MIMAIKNIRTKKGLSQIEFAALCSVTQGTVSQWESEAILPSTKILPRIADVLGCSIDDLYAERGTQNVHAQ